MTIKHSYTNNYMDDYCKFVKHIAAGALRSSQSQISIAIL